LILQENNLIIESGRLCSDTWN